MLSKNGDYVCVLSPVDGPMRQRLTDIGIDVIVDELVLTQNKATFDFSKNFDLAIANTIVAWPFITQMGNNLPVYWYVHEGDLIDHYVNSFPDFIKSFSHATGIWVGSKKSGIYLARHGIADFTIVPYGVEAAAVCPSVQPVSIGSVMKIGLFGSVEPRKGQDLAVLGLLSLPVVERRGIELRLFGRTLDKVYANAVEDIANGDPSIAFCGELTPDGYKDALAQVDVVIVPSRDDTLPLVSLDALAAAKPLVVSRTTGTSDWLENDISGFLLDHNSPDEIGEVLRKLRADLELRTMVGAAGRVCFEQNFSWDGFVTRILALIASPQPVRLSTVAEQAS
jgi:glycosyltransferase involved in cell wall biosynthesis